MVLVSDGNFMKKQAGTASLTFIFFLFHASGIGSSLDFSKAIHYTPPTNFISTPLGSDDDLFGGNMATFQYSSGDQCSTVIFQLGLACFYVGEGKVIKFLPAKPTDLKESLGNEYKGRLPNLTPAVIGELHGLTDVSLTATRPPGGNPRFFEFCWTQLETNIVVKVTAVSCDYETFKELTNSWQSLKIDKDGILKQLASQK
jgi:hypothetical protein